MGQKQDPHRAASIASHRDISHCRSAAGRNCSAPSAGRRWKTPTALPAPGSHGG
ncbi:hypothetical protein TVNIR_1312 [Thioalkalivibrio nitratireducens DSM 14787]|uniref:Uncharacterized protein n=1 Tax=Thioalkalivibrio nitratireducens (strain DSM 14787 / UNIQEM 213 / ALEN2) TaxID=1255043 RepID=L0DXB0_THIND|nr:hypothetical protein TVNIR_1312 [Thioalkalivibrio nitratireducens DSM 14787]